MKKKIKYKNVVLLFLVLLIIMYGISKISFSKSELEEPKPEIVKLTTFDGMNIEEVRKYCNENSINLLESFDYNEIVLKDVIIDSNIDNNDANVLISKGNIPYEEYQTNKVNELGNVPIMMYHGIVNTTTNKYTGGNVDKDGYNRTSEAFRKDLEFYYENNYRMISLIDYVNGKIDVEMGYSPIILTFDDGLENNIKVTGRDESNNIIIDPNSAIGILESFREKHPDMNVTATFFITSNLFEQKEYNKDILNWLVEHGYDVGNHTTGHNNLNNTTTSKTQQVIGEMYQILENYLKDKYVPIIALPYGNPLKKTHANFPYVLSGKYNDYEYETLAALRVGWDSEYSPFNKNFDKTYLKRCRAYDNNGEEFDIKMVFNLLSKTRFISDGDINTVVFKESNSSKLADKINENLKVIKY